MSKSSKATTGDFLAAAVVVAVIYCLFGELGLMWLAATICALSLSFILLLVFPDTTLMLTVVLPCLIFLGWTTVVHIAYREQQKGET